MDHTEVDALDAALEGIRQSRPKGSEPEVTSSYGLEAENIRLKEELKTTRTKVSRLKGEVRRLHEKVTLLSTAFEHGKDYQMGYFDGEENLKKKFASWVPNDTK